MILFTSIRHKIFLKRKDVLLAWLQVHHKDILKVQAILNDLTVKDTKKNP